MASDQLTFATIHHQVRELLERADGTPIALRLGTVQREAIEQYVRETSGQADVGPLLSFAGLDVRNSKRADVVELVWASTLEEEAPSQEPEAEPSAPV